MAGAPARRRSRRRALPLAWLLAATALGVLGWLLSAVSDRPQERSAGAVLLGAALVAVLVAGAPPAAPRARATSLGASALVLLAGAAAAVAVLAGPAGAGDVALVLGVPAACALATAWLALRERPPGR
ncbi:hypothetical protein [Quadrisphaera sp. DSM 44207]|uniref:hypothetical protein n=1 Tax=Quadrisphaera sp. DSM 44207 TaxID=1881057 RepID=UPI00088D1717|nr:hypothetical protein [Quadrisphaera sp. DSM 44207]SDQ48603.1 hypothetical protein SAMN05428996_1890 [Quadrisphaera sp. DSM 44207]